MYIKYNDELTLKLNEIQRNPYEAQISKIIPVENVIIDTNPLYPINSTANLPVNNEITAFNFSNMFINGGYTPVGQNTDTLNKVGIIDTTVQLTHTSLIIEIPLNKIGLTNNLQALDYVLKASEPHINNARKMWDATALYQFKANSTSLPDTYQPTDLSNLIQLIKQDLTYLKTAQPNGVWTIILDLSSYQAITMYNTMLNRINLEDEVAKLNMELVIITDPTSLLDRYMGDVVELSKTKPDLTSIKMYYSYAPFNFLITRVPPCLLQGTNGNILYGVSSDSLDGGAANIGMTNPNIFIPYRASNVNRIFDLSKMKNTIDINVVTPSA